MTSASTTDRIAQQDIAGPLDVDASLNALRARAQARLDARARPALIDAALRNHRALAFSFAGQGAAYFDELTELWGAGGAPRALLDACFAALIDEAAVLDPLDAGRLPAGIDVVAWLSGARPDEATLAKAAVSAPLTFITQLARAEQLFAGGIDELFAQPEGRRPLVVGHSQGLLGALALAQSWGRPIDERARTVAQLARVALRLGCAMEDHELAAASPATVRRSLDDTGGAPTFMAAISGLSARELRAAIVALGLDVAVALESAPTHQTVAGAPEALEALRLALAEQSRTLRDQQRRGAHAGRVPEARFSWLAVSGPFHTRHLQRACDRLLAQVKPLAAGALATPAALTVLDAATGMPLGDQRGDNAGALADVLRSILVRPGSFQRCLESLVAGGVDTVIDLGPGVDVVHLAASALRGRAVLVSSACVQDERAVLLDLRRAPAVPAPWSAMAPRAVDDGRGLRLDNRFTRLTGRAPFIVPGMTPTTVEAPIVVAAANAGYLAELAGGGQVTERHLRARIDEARRTLKPGQGLVVNALYLDPYLWGLHLGKQRLIFKLRDEGYPILGVTISAGVPPLEEAVALLDDLHAHGLWCNALKPGTDRQIDEVIAIAKARPGRALMVHVEGGKAGGHHSWEDLDDLLLRNYAKLRAVDDVVLCVGGGIGTEEQASSYLFGTWSERHGRAPMPVDAVFLGTRLMATREACTSPAVKEALVVAPGDEQRWPVGGGVAGGVISGKSSLDAPIYFLDNAAARAGRLLDEVAGDSARVAARKDEIVLALALTAKPYFGDIDDMTPLAALERLLDLTAAPSADPLGDSFADGVWLDPSWQERFVALARRFEARLAPATGVASPTIVTNDAARDPRALLAALQALAPALTTSLVHPDDARFFLGLCRRPGKPVPFVPVLDADVRRWFASDSLWQSHDARFGADAVLALPGPAALASVRQVDEPVAEVLRGFERHAVARAVQRGVHVQPRAELATRAREYRVAVDEHGWWHENPLQRLRGQAGLSVEERAGKLAAALTLPTGATLDLCLSLDGDAPGGGLRVDRAAFVRAQQQFYAHALFGEPVTPVALFDTAREQVLVSAARCHDFRAATGDDNAVHPPLSMAFSLAWRAIFRALSGTQPDVLQLVHESDRVEGSGFGLGDRLEAAARVVLLEEVQGGRRVVVEAMLVDAAGALRAQLTSSFFIRRSVPSNETRREDRGVRARLAADAGALAFLGGVAGVHLDAKLPSTGVLELDARVTERGALGRLVVGDTVVGSLTMDPGAFDALVATLVEREPAVPATGRLGERRAHAPRSLVAYAAASGDHNPLHTSPAVAAVAGLPGPIVHGMWTAAFALHRVTRLAADGDGARVTSMAARFLAPVVPGAALTVSVDTRARVRGALDVRATVEADGVVCAEVDARVAPPATAYLFPGQGVQHAGMGSASRAASAAARAVWDEADRVCREHHGFSLLHVIDDNPRELWLRGERLVHPDGVLFLTQFTQVALAVLAVAEVAALREQQLFVEDARFAGHSLGEYSALAAVPGVLPLAAVVDVVYRRGLTMDRLVPRDEQGRSPYGMVALRPNLAGLDERAALALVDEVAAATGLPLFVVNHNVRGRQYAVTGDVRALDALKARLPAAPGAKAPVVEVPGIDVPFHSPLLASGVDAFRATLEAALPARIDAQALVGRYLPNLTGSLFRLEPAFLREVLAASGSTRVAGLLDRFDDAAKDADALARALLVEVLAYQFASPVQWIAIQHALLTGTAQVGQLVEVGPAQAPVLAGMARAELERLPARSGARPRVLHAIADREGLLGTSMVEADTPPPPAPSPRKDTAVAKAPSAMPLGAPEVAEAASAVGQAAQPLPAAGPFAEDGVVTLVGLLIKKSRADLDVTRSLDALLGGNSARRNQVLAEIAVEAGGRSIDNAHELPLGQLASLIAKTSTAEGPGAALRPLREQALQRLFGAAGLDVAKVHEHLEREWALPRPHRELLLNRLALAARVEQPAADRAAAHVVIDRAVSAYGVELGVTVARATATRPVAAVDSAALDDLEDRLLGKDGALADAARALLRHVDPAAVARTAAVAPATTPADPEHDEAYRAAVAPIFDERLHVAFTSAWAWVRRDRLDGSVSRASVLARSAPGGRFAGQTALVTGAGEGSIARAVVARLLAEGARVVVTTSRRSPEAARSFKQLYQEHARVGAELHVVPCNQGSFTDVDALCAWLGAAKRERVGSSDKVVKAPFVPDLLVPFGAIAESADVGSMGPRSLALFRVLVLGVERLVARCAELALSQGSSGRRVHVLLPLSPNHGTFGGDGAYGECKAALEALVHKQGSEAHRWGRGASIVGARIGWVRGTGLMHANDGAAAYLQQRGLRTFDVEEMAELLLEQATEPARSRAAKQAFTADLTGGLGEVNNLSALLAEYRDVELERRRTEARRDALSSSFDQALVRHGAKRPPAPAERAVLPRATMPVPVPTEAELAQLPPLDHLDLDRVAVIVGTGEVGPWGSARTRWAMEQGRRLSLEAVLELAWMMGLVVPDPKGSGFLDGTSLTPVDEATAHERYEAHVLTHCGVRVVEPAVTGFDPRALPTLVEVRLERDFAFPVSTRAIGASIVADDPERSVLLEDTNGACSVLRKKGSVLKVPAALSVRRAVAGQLPTGWDATRFGVPKSLVEQVDPVTLYCLVSTAEAFLAAGMTPEELLAHLHPSRVGVTIGTGIGGMAKLKRLHRDLLEGKERQNDTLQETLINVIGGYVVQAFLGCTGPMSFPVGACATGGLSLAEALDKIRTGQADLVVAGGADDLSEAGLIGFGDMGATADTDELAARGIEPRFMSRGSDARRRGFIEAHGAGVAVVCTASLAQRLGLPVYGVLAFAGTSGDGLQKSVPAPGQGALSFVAERRTADRRHDDSACALLGRRERLHRLEQEQATLAAVAGVDEAARMLRDARRRLGHEPGEGRDDVSPLRAALAVLGLTADDVAVVSKHDSSTQANDENEARLHETIMSALGRKDDHPLWVISQKALTGHPKGAAAAWQVNGLLQAMASSTVPPNTSLDDVAGEMRAFPRLVWTDRPVQLARPMLAGLVTTLGFGHVSALVCLAHPSLFWRMLSDQARADYGARLEARRRRAEQRLQRVLSGREPLFTVREPRLAHDEEASLLLDAGARMHAMEPRA
ncbi:MAG: DUF1729 domain-containing protein [Deltaproteobacteria bacterium]|nr:DUF1729 domain-containing protein [Deltaproteobacteria bacterium]